MLTYAVWGLGRKMFTKLRFQSRSKKIWNRWLIKQYAIIVWSRLINTHIRIMIIIISQLFLSIANALHGSLALTLSIKNFGVYLISLLVVFVMLIMQYRLQFWQRHTNMRNINIRSRSKYEIWCSKM